jgi:hypothetical protein
MDNTITLSLRESEIDNLHKETKISKRLLTINNLINNIIDDKRNLNEAKQEIKHNLKAIEGLGWDLSWEKSNKIIREKTSAQLEIENDISSIRDDNQWQRDFIKILKDSIAKRENQLKKLL